jgi:hypothetical protein
LILKLPYRPPQPERRFNAGKWEQALKAEFKKITIPIPGEVYKSGPRKGQRKVRKAKLSEGWGLIDAIDGLLNEVRDSAAEGWLPWQKLTDE